MSKTKPSNSTNSISVIILISIFILGGYLTNQYYLKNSADQITYQSTIAATSAILPIVTQLPTQAIQSEQALSLDRQPVEEYRWQAEAISDHYPNPATPISVIAQDIKVGQRVQLSWDMPVGQTSDGFTIYRSTTPTPQASDLIGQAGSNETSYLDTTVENGTTYYYAVRSFRYVSADQVFSEWSDIHSVIPTDSVAPQAPTYVTASPVAENPSQLTIKWRPVPDSDVVRYKIYRSNSPATLGDSITEVQPDVTTVIDTTLTAGLKYFYTVTAIDSSDNESTTQFSIGAYGNPVPFVVHAKP